MTEHEHGNRVTGPESCQFELNFSVEERRDGERETE